MQIIKQTIIEILQKCGISGEISLNIPPNPEMGDFAFACFPLAKELRKNPMEVARQLVDAIEREHLEHYDMFQDVAAEGPYVNFYVKTSFIAWQVFEQLKIQAQNYGSNNLGQGKKVMIEYPGENSHKEFHIGHLRNLCIGNVLVQLYRKNGYEVVPVNYFNDFGAHVVKCLWGIQKFHANEEPAINKQKWLGEIYAEASNYIKDHEEVKPEIAQLQKELEAHDQKIWPLFEKTRQWSLEGFEKLHQELGAEYKKVFSESEVKALGQKMVDELLERGVAMVGEGGAIIVDLSKYGLDIALVRKSSGAGLYITSDLALAKEKFASFDVVESIYVTGIEQVFQFKQLFKVLELYGFKEKMTHIGYGLITLAEGKMSSRLGNVILYEDLRNQVLEKLTEESKNRHQDWSEEKISSITKTLSLAVLKFSIQKHEANKNIVFDMKEAVSFEGFSAPYILYVVARINSLLKKAGDISDIGINYDFFEQREEKHLLILLAGYSDVLRKALENYNPSVVAKYCFDLAQAFNDFYAKHSILQAEQEGVKQARLALCQAVKQVLTSALKILTIETVDEM